MPNNDDDDDVSDRVKPFVIFNIQALWCSELSVSARMSQITNDGLTRSGTGCFISCTCMATVAIKRLKQTLWNLQISALFCRY